MCFQEFGSARTLELLLLCMTDQRFAVIEHHLLLVLVVSCQPHTSQITSVDMCHHVGGVNSLIHFCSFIHLILQVTVL